MAQFIDGVRDVELFVGSTPTVTCDWVDGAVMVDSIAALPRNENSERVEGQRRQTRDDTATGCFGSGSYQFIPAGGPRAGPPQPTHLQVKGTPLRRPVKKWVRPWRSGRGPYRCTRRERRESAAVF